MCVKPGDSNNDILFSFTCYLTPTFVNIFFPQCNVATGVQGGCLPFISVHTYSQFAIIVTALCCSYLGI